MCGFLCSVGTDIAALKGLAKLRHRGPDELGGDSMGNVGMWHARLSVTGVKNGMQPIRNEAGNIMVAVNGEFYGLSNQRGHTYSTASDSEHLVHLYEDYGVDCLARLHGEFVFTLYDEKCDTIFAARDRFGTKPLYYARHGTGFVFASELNALVAAGFKAELDEEALVYCLSHGYFEPGRCLLKGVHTIRPGHYLLIKDGNVETKRYWQPPFAEDGSIEPIKGLLTQAIRTRIPAESRWCTHLSGGLDSTLVTALAGRIARTSVPCYTIAFEGDAYNEESDAKRSAEFLRANLTVVPATQAEMMKEFTASVLSAGGPANNLHVAAKRILARRIRDDGFKVVLSGEGSDEIFLGYEHLRIDAGVNTGAISTVAGIHAGATPAKGGFVWDAAKMKMGASLLSVSKHPDWVMSAPLLGAGLSSHPKEASEAWMTHAMSDYILVRLDDAQNMAFSLESRLPFLDTALAEAAFKVPTNDLIGTGALEKQILRDTFADILPAWISEQRKRPFQAPPVILPVDRLRNSRLANHFNIDKLEALVATQETQPASAIACLMWSFAELFDHFKIG